MEKLSEEDFFEGTEKLLEIWFTSSTNDQNGDLRIIDRTEWVKLLKLVKCEIISYMKNDHMDSYVLSESSMFVTQNRLILKTCGTTTLLAAVKSLIQLVKSKCGFDTVADVFYSRKNFTHPELQHILHQSFDKEVHLLDQIFTNGSAYVLGRMNKDCWYLYTLDSGGINQPDQTLELIMWDLCPNKMKIFTKEVCTTGKEATQRSGISDIIPDMKVDEHLFQPCGYSMNGLLLGGVYITAHVTPESHCSYASFESNVPLESYHDLIQKVLQIFKPGKFLITIIANKASIAQDSHKQFKEMNNIEGYARHYHYFCNFKNYDLTYAQFSRPVI